MLLVAHLTSVEPWEVAYFNGAALLDEIPVATRDTHEQFALRDRCQPEPQTEVPDHLSAAVKLVLFMHGRL